MFQGLKTGKDILEWFGIWYRDNCNGTYTVVIPITEDEKIMTSAELTEFAMAMADRCQEIDRMLLGTNKPTVCYCLSCNDLVTVSDTYTPYCMVCGSDIGE